MKNKLPLLLAIGAGITCSIALFGMTRTNSLRQSILFAGVVLGITSFIFFVVKKISR